MSQAAKELGQDAEDVLGWGRLKELKASVYQPLARIELRTLMHAASEHGSSNTAAVGSSAHITLKSKMLSK